MNVEFNPNKLHECAESGCGEIVIDGFCYRLNAHEVVCLTCFVEASVCAWQAEFYDPRTAQ